MHTSTTSTALTVPWSAHDLQTATQGSWYQNNIPTHDIQRILTDSREAKAGDLFLALKGERFDAHNFVDQVAQQGCSAVIVERALPIDLPQLIVPDTRMALGHLGAYRRRQYENLNVIALTGSSGKTTTKEMLGSILSRLAPTLITRGNLNNDLGVPMMLLELRPEHQYAVMELGANHIGEIAYTSNLVCPHVAGILNIGTAHLGEFGGRDKICQAKSEIYTHLKLQDTAIIPQHDDYAQTIQKTTSHLKTLSFGDGGDVFASNIQIQPQATQFKLHTPQGEATLNLPFAGLHNVQNALAATAFALALNVSLDDIVQGLENAKNAKGRLNFIPHQHHLFIDDTYNANPTSMRAAAQVLEQQTGVRVMVIGDIGELGDDAEQEHIALGHDLAKMNLEYVVTVGAYAHATRSSTTQENKIHAFKTQADALPFLMNIIEKHQPQAMSFLFKGSRFMHMETLMADVMEKL